MKFIAALLVFVTLEGLDAAVTSCLTADKGIYSVGQSAPCTNNQQTSCKSWKYIKADRSGYEYTKACSGDPCDSPDTPQVLPYIHDQETFGFECCTTDDCNNHDLQEMALGPKCLECEGDRKTAGDTCVDGSTAASDNECDAVTKACRVKVEGNAVIRDCATKGDDSGEVTGCALAEKFCLNLKGCNSDAALTKTPCEDKKLTDEGKGDEGDEDDGDGEGGAQSLFVSYYTLILLVLVQTMHEMF